MEMIAALCNRLIAVLYIAFIAITSIPFFLVAVVLRLCTGPFDPRLTLLHQFTCLWASLYLWVFPAWSAEILDRDRIDPAKTYVMVSNHQSLVDILLVFRLFTHFKWVSKKEVFSLPLIGWNMVLNGYVKLARGQQESVVRMYEACDAHLRQGSSIYMFPEGTRSTSDEMREFKEGAFILAKNNKVPLLVLAIDGTRDALPKHSLTFHGSHRITLAVIDELAYEDFAETPPKELAAEVRARIADYLRRRHLESATDESSALPPHPGSA